MADLPGLIQKRGYIKARLTRIVNFVKDFETGGNINQLKERLILLREIQREFDSIQFEIEILDPAAAEKNDSDVFEALYFDTVSDIQTVLEDRTSNAPRSIASPQNVQDSDQQLNVKLPILNLPEFSGSYCNWKGFWDSFTTVIHQNLKLNDCERFHYLKSCLIGEPLRMVASLPVSEANYASAWNILKKRYDNKRLIVQEHVKSILKLPATPKPSHFALREFLNQVNSSVASLKVLGIPVESWDAIIVPILTEKLDYVSINEWQTKLTCEIPRLDELIEFIEKRCDILDSLNALSKPHQANSNPTNKFQNKSPMRHVAHVGVNKPSCAQCKHTSHNIYQCLDFLKLSVSDRLKQVEKFELCSNCLRSNHKINNCRSALKCRECKQRHNSLLHITANLVSNSDTDASLRAPEPSTSTQAMHCVKQNPTISVGTVLLSTALVYVKDKNGSLHEARALLDVGSQSSFITKGLAEILNLQETSINISVTGINKNISYISKQVGVTIRSRYNKFTAKIRCLILPKITENLPSHPINITNVRVPPNLKLADPNFSRQGPIDLLIGAELFWEILCVGQLQLDRCQPYFQKTHLGWIVGGNLKTSASLSTTSCNLATSALSNLESGLTKFWELEQYPVRKRLSAEEQNSENHFKATVRRETNGRFIVKLPGKNENFELGSSYEIALKRFYNLERKLNNNAELKLQYVNFINEYRELTHMELVPEHQINAVGCYLPHHPVIKESSTTTKLRVVFDASAKTNNGFSLNDKLLCGPVIQQDLFSILTRFRTFQYVLTADIAKMYRQIRVHSDQIDYQRILWRDNPEEPICIFRLLTLTYGTKPASFIATRCLQELASLNQLKYPVSSHVIVRDFYMDDLITGGNSTDMILKLKNDITEILAQGGFELRKFASNCDPSILRGDAINGDINLDKNGETKTLGLIWNCRNDFLKYKVKTELLSSRITKRSILSAIAQIFDPLGLITPVTMKAKIVLQQLWSLKLAWDETVPMNIHSTWTEFLSKLSFLNNLEINRKVVASYPFISVELHGFCDASQLGYAAAVYIKTIDNSNNHSAQLLCAKSRVAPLKTITIPRLELCAAVLLAKLVESIKTTLDLDISRCNFWTDSTIVLAWLSIEPNTLNTFVANRVAEIQSLTSRNDWNHIKSSDNPADIASRGSFPQDLITTNAWFHGPIWLSSDEQPQSSFDARNIEVPEKRKIIAAFSMAHLDLDFLTKYSSFSKLQRVIAYCLRFIHNCKNKDSKLVGSISSKELQSATLAVVRVIQQCEFSRDIKKLKRHSEVEKSSKILSLNPFLCENGLLRVGGRLKNAPLSNDIKYPIILPKKHYVTKLIIISEHTRQLHAGAQATLAALRQRYWIIGAKDIIRQILYKCVKCFRAKPSTVVQKMGDFPKDRVQPTRPFLISGVDYAGPILAKDGRGRGKRTIKVYIALFICFATKAVHLELVGDLTSESFLNALKRFIARRGHVSCLYSDNASNFIGAKKELAELAQLFKNQRFRDNLVDSSAAINVNWKFIPPRAPNMGGLWEINIKAVKYHLKRIMGNALLTYEELYTLLTRIESCLNSRPLTPLTSDPNDLVALTPGHFLIGEPLMTMVEPDVAEIKTNALSRWQRVEQLRQHFWKRWRREYLLQMQQRTKWRLKAPELIEIGQMVLLAEDNVPPQQWPLGRIIELHPGADNIVRVVSVKTVRGVSRRPINKVCVLPIDGNV